jgi:hypothetical protein
LKEQPLNHASATPTPPASSNPAHHNYDPDSPPTKRFAVGAILVTLALLVAMLGLLLYRALTQRAPSAGLVIQADPHWDGAQLLVMPAGAARDSAATAPSPGAGGTNGQRNLAGTLSRSNKFAITFFLNPGVYEVRVMTDMRELFRQTVTLTEQQPQIGLDLTKSRVPPPHPTTDPS